MKYLKKIFENYNIYLNDKEIINNSKELYDIFNIDNINTKIEIDVDWYIEIALSIIVDFCIKYNIVPNKKIIDNLIYYIKTYIEEYIIYKDVTYNNWDTEFNWVIKDLLYYLKKELPTEYEKYLKKSKSERFNI